MVMDNSVQFPGILPVYTSGWSAGLIRFEAGDHFWPAVRKFAAEGSLAASVDKAMMGGSAPRIWLILHQKGNEGLSAAAALSFASELAQRDQASLVLDCDHERRALTLWAGRDEAEGWIDLARFGTSVMASSEALPFEGRSSYLLGVGSFVPPDLGASEISGLMARLRRQADDIFLVAPADPVGLMWAEVADIRLLCWDRSQGDAGTCAEISTEFASAGCPLTGAVAFGVPDAYVAASKEQDESLLVEERLVEDEEPELDPFLSFEDAPPPAGDPAPDGQEDAPEWDDMYPSPLPAGGGGSRAKGSSRVFWIFAASFLVVIALVSVWYLKFGRVPPDGLFDQVAETRAPATDVFQQALDPEPTVGETTPTAEDSTAFGLGLAMVDSATMAVDTTTIVTVGQADADAPPREDSSAETMAPAPEETTGPAAVAFSMAPYQVPVGTEGWALHVFSFPDSAGTETQLLELDRRGFESTVEIVELPDKGRWWRIYLGSFPSRKSARDAMPALLAKLRTDWAKPVEF